MSSKTSRKPASQPDPKKRRNVVIAIVVAVAVAVAAVVIVAGSGSDDKSSGTKGGSVAGLSETTELLDGIPQKDATLGKPDAPVTVFEYIDYQCPFCRQFALGALPVIVNDYVRPGKVKIVLEPLTFIGPDSEKAARAGAAAGQQDRQWTFTELFFHNQGQENSGYVTDAFVDKLYDAAGVDKAKANAYRDSEASKEQPDGAQDGAEKYGVVSTPSFVVGKTGGPYQKIEVDIGNPEGFKAALDALLK